MKKRFYIGLIVFAVLVLALGGLVFIRVKRSHTSLASRDRRRLLGGSVRYRQVSRLDARSAARVEDDDSSALAHNLARRGGKRGSLPYKSVTWRKAS